LTLTRLKILKTGTNSHLWYQRSHGEMVAEHPGSIQAIGTSSVQQLFYNYGDRYHEKASESSCHHICL